MFIYLIVSFDFFLRGVLVFVRLRFLKLSNFLVFNVMVFEDKSIVYIVILFIIVVCIFLLLLFKDSRKVIGIFKNNVLLRLEKVRFKNNKYWFLSLVFFLILFVFLIIVVYSYIIKLVVLILF